MGWSVSRSNRLQWEFWLMNLLRGGDSLHFFLILGEPKIKYIHHTSKVTYIYIFRIIIATYIQDFQFIGWMVSVFCFWEDMLMMMMMTMTMTTITIPNAIHTLESSTIDHFHTSLISLYVFVYPCIPSGTFLTPISSITKQRSDLLPASESVLRLNKWSNPYLPSGKLSHSELENHHAFNGKIHYFYGHFQ